MARGGYKPGAGRPKGSKTLHKRPETATPLGGEALAGAYRDLLGIDEPKDESPMEYGLRVMRDPLADRERRDRMAIALLPYLHKRQADARPTVREQRKTAAKEAGAGLFAPSAPPARLVAVN
jgi:hypothetical protein